MITIALKCCSCKVLPRLSSGWMLLCCMHASPRSAVLVSSNGVCVDQTSVARMVCHPNLTKFTLHVAVVQSSSDHTIRYNIFTCVQKLTKWPGQGKVKEKTKNKNRLAQTKRCKQKSVKAARECNTLCTSGFLENVKFSHNGASGPECKTFEFARRRHR